MPFIKIIIDAVWSTKDRKPLMNKEQKDALCTHIREYALSKDIHLLNINGHADHLHALLSLTSGQNIETILNLLKGESSFWANRNLRWAEKFGWQDEYFAVSVSGADFGRVSAYTV